MGRILFQSRSAPGFRFLSNFHLAEFESRRVRYPSVEHYYQALKAIRTDDFLMVLNAKTPKEARDIGQTIGMHPNWVDLKDEVMLDGVRLKFGQNPHLRERLLATGEDELVEFAPWGDTYWGVGKDMVGRNVLGKLLMRVRKELA